MAMHVGPRGRISSRNGKVWSLTSISTPGARRPLVSATSSPGRSEPQERSPSAARPWTTATALTEQQCWDLLDLDLAGSEAVVNDAAKVSLNQNQFDALVSFVFNVGDGLLRLLNQGQPDQVPAQLQRWVMDNGHVVQGLVNRRNKEIALWNTPV